MGYLIGMAPVAYLGVIGSDRASYRKRWARLGGWAYLGSAVSLASSVLSTKPVGTKALEFLGGELSTVDQMKIEEQLDKQVSEPAEFLSSVLGWNAKQKAQFSHALNRRVIYTMNITAREFGIRVHQQDSDVTHDRAEKFGGKVVASLSQINFIDIIEKEGLFKDETQLQALRQMAALQELIEKLEKGSPGSVQAILRNAEPQKDTDGNSLVGQDYIDSILRLQKALKATEAGIPPGSAAGQSLKELSEKTKKAVENLRKYCGN
jgi:hypothetical protein